VGHHALAEQAQHVDRYGKHGDVARHRHQHRRSGKQGHDDQRHLLRRITVDDLAEFGQRQRAGKRCAHVERAEAAMTEPVFGADLARRQRDEEGLAEGGKKGQQKTAGKPAGIVAQEGEKHHGRQ
jgi:hypothetical protein